MINCNRTNLTITNTSNGARHGRGARVSPLPGKMSLSPHSLTDAYQPGCQLIPQFRILIVSAVKTYKQCLQTASASAVPHCRPPTGARFLNPTGDFRPNPPVDISCGVFHSCLKTSFSQSLSLHSRLCLPQADLQL